MPVLYASILQAVAWVLVIPDQPRSVGCTILGVVLLLALDRIKGKG